MKRMLLIIILLALAPLGQAQENLQGWRQALVDKETLLTEEMAHLRQRQKRVEQLLTLLDQSPRRSDGNRQFLGQWYSPAQLARQAQSLRARHRQQALLLQAMAQELNIMGGRREALAWRIQNTTRK